MGKNIGILLLSITVILSAATFLTTQTLDKSTNDVGFLLGHMTLKVIDENGYVKDYRQTDNIIVSVGWDELVRNTFSGDYTIDPDGFGQGALQSFNPGPFSHIAIGSDDGNSLFIGPDNTALGLELSGCPRSPIGIHSDGAFGTSISEITVTLFAGFDAETSPSCGGIAISEAGLFNGTAAQNTVMFARNTFTEIPPLGSFDFLEIEWEFTFTSGPPGLG